jgi:hypothetical protein
MEMRWKKKKSYARKQIYFSMNDENAIVLKHFDLKTSAMWRL